MDAAQLAVAGLCLLASSLFWSESFEPDSRTALTKEQHLTALKMYHGTPAGSRRYELLESIVTNGEISLPRNGPDRTLAEITGKLGLTYKRIYE